MNLYALKNLRKNKIKENYVNKKTARFKRSIKNRIKLKKLNKIRLVVHRTSRHIYAQIINPISNILVSASTLEKNIKKNIKYSGNKDAAIFIGKKIAERALKMNISHVSFDRSGFKYHGRIKSLADAARTSGLKF